MQLHTGICLVALAGYFHNEIADAFPVTRQTLRRPGSLALRQKRFRVSTKKLALSRTSRMPTQTFALTPVANILPGGSSFRSGFLALVSVTVLSGYHVRLIRREAAGKPTWRSSQARTRQEWSQHVRQTEGWLYAVQTLRNAITANTFLATTVLSLLTVISGKLWDMVQGGTYPGDRSLFIVQFVTIALTMFTSAYQFLQSARLMTHAGFMFPVRNGPEVDEIMRKSQNAQWLGLRWLYLSLSVMCWIAAGGNGFLLSSLASTQFFRSIDRVPVGAADVPPEET